MTDDTDDTGFRVDLSRGFNKWLASKNASLAVTTYQTGKILLFGLEDDDALWSYNRNIGRCLGLTTHERGFWVTSDTQIFRFENLLLDNQMGSEGIDACFAPRFSYYTGDLDVHDLVTTQEHGLLFANTLFNTVAKPSTAHSFEPLWRPEFISRLAAEDRCHLNGLAVRDGKLRYVTSISRTDVFDGWRDHRESGGVVIDVETNEIICSGLSMPHSPRWHKNKLWLHNSGAGEFGHVDLETKEFIPVAFLPGYLRGLDFLDENTAMIGLSLPRNNKTFSGLPLDSTLAEKQVSARCGIYFVDLKTGDILHNMKFGGAVKELYDVAVLPGVRKPAMIGPTSPELNRTFSVPQIN